MTAGLSLSHKGTILLDYMEVRDCGPVDTGLQPIRGWTCWENLPLDSMEQVSEL